MPTLYIANTTKQHHNFCYRLRREPPDHKLYEKVIMSATQDYIHEFNTDMDTINCILGQHERYGLIHVSKISNMTEFVGLCYSLDEPVPAVEQVDIFRHNDDVLKAEGVETRKQVAAAISDGIQKSTQALRQFEMETIEETRDGSRAVVSDGVRVIMNG